MKDRINSVLQKYNLTSSDFADKIGVGKSNISHILGGRNNPSLEIVKRILQEYPEINSEWLLFGTGAMTKEIIKESNIKVETAVIKQNINPQLEFKEDDNIELEIPIKDPSITEANTTIEMNSDTNPNVTIETREVKQVDVKDEINKISKTVTRIVLYYSDNTYQQFDPNNSPL